MDRSDQSTIRMRNASLVLNLLRLHAPLSRAEIAKRTQLNRSTISEIVDQLLEEELIYEAEVQSDRVGRPGTALRINPGGGAIIGISISPEKVSAVMTDLIATIHWQRRLIISDEPQETFIRMAENFIRTALHEATERVGRVLGIGVSLPGLIDVQTGELHHSFELHWERTPLRAMWESAFGVPVFVENSANAAALCEYYWGAARACSNFLYIGAGASLGGGIVIDGQLFRGRGGYAGEIGHMTVDPNGVLCECGKHGCWETLVGPNAVVRNFKQRVESHYNGNGLHHGNHGTLQEGTPGVIANGNGLRRDLSDVTFLDIAQGAVANDFVALSTLQQMARYLGIGIGNLVNIFNPELVVLGGSFSQAGDILVSAIKETVKQSSLFPMRSSLTIVPSYHGQDDMLLGAVALVLDDIMRSPLRKKG